MCGDSQHDFQALVLESDVGHIKKVLLYCTNCGQTRLCKHDKETDQYQIFRTYKPEEESEK